jgi:hypothetical protein
LPSWIAWRDAAFQCIAWSLRSCSAPRADRTFRRLPLATAIPVERRTLRSWAALRIEHPAGGAGHGQDAARLVPLRKTTPRRQGRRRASPPRAPRPGRERASTATRTRPREFRKRQYPVSGTRLDTAARSPTRSAP